jgi:hypothetical protein
VKYAGCTTFGTAVKVIVTAATYEYNANGTETIVNPISLTPTGLGCHYEIPAQSGFTKELLAFGDETFYGNTKFPEGQLKLNLYTTLTGMHYTAFGWPCTGPKTPAEAKEGKAAEETGEAGHLVAAIHEEIQTGNLTWIK